MACTAFQSAKLQPAHGLFIPVRRASEAGASSLEAPRGRATMGRFLTRERS
ncbi:hypothetical protein LILAB_19215 [Corallococcus macrosporus]|uniref:Uncharacterized protein n=1 Tax=Myxococcus fulvus (strain ATCC BAA-855 / HW-1) TaxID=483219 RepID=F8C944_MYXFH|nr:hypothetical protein LILAB_19215 [Corallococcus macrosporus]